MFLVTAIISLSFSSNKDIILYTYINSFPYYDTLASDIFVLYCQRCYQRIYHNYIMFAISVLKVRSKLNICRRVFKYE